MTKGKAIAIGAATMLVSCVVIGHPLVNFLIGIITFYICMSNVKGGKSHE